MVSAASCERGTRLCSMVLKLVPASLPIKPAEAKADNAPTASSTGMPKFAATRPDWFSAAPRSSTLPCALSEPLASRSATRVKSSPCNLNCVRALAAISAAAPTSRVPAALRARAPSKPPARMSAALTPAFAKASTALSASLAPTPNCGPRLRAASPSASMFARYSPPRARTLARAWSKLTTAFTALPSTCCTP